jgi:hypothetical protein
LAIDLSLRGNAGINEALRISLRSFSVTNINGNYERERTSEATAGMAHKLAHRINNPLQSLTNTIFLARHGKNDVEEHFVQA